jgi:hypothetical protein
LGETPKPHFVILCVNIGVGVCCSLISAKLKSLKKVFKILIEKVRYLV